MELPAEVLQRREWEGEVVGRRIADLSYFSQNNEHRAPTHNKGITNGITGVALATGQDTRAIEAACHSSTARDGGTYGPMSVWRYEDDTLRGQLDVPLPMATVGGELKHLPQARVPLENMGVESGDELAEVTAAVGLAQNFAALNMLSTIGVTEGHGAHRS